MKTSRQNVISLFWGGIQNFVILKTTFLKRKISFLGEKCAVFLVCKSFEFYAMHFLNIKLFILQQWFIERTCRFRIFKEKFTEIRLTALYSVRHKIGGLEKFTGIRLTALCTVRHWNDLKRQANNKRHLLWF